jgi:serine protease Do
LMPTTSPRIFSSVKQVQAVLAKLDKAKVINLLVRRGDLTSFVLLRPAR